MNWSGRFVFGPAWAAYRGPADDNSPHAHAALQLAFGLEEDVRLYLAPGDERCAPGFLVQAGVLHAILSRGTVGLIYIEPQTRLARVLLDAIGEGAATPLPANLLDHLDRQANPEAWLQALQTLFSSANHRRLDARLAQALRRLADQPTLALAEVARGCGVSPSHLRELARTQLGLPLSTWLLWRKLERTVREISAGAGLAEAAITGGFADQAHFARTMRRMFGVTPGAVKSMIG